ncbi:VIR protein [Plasmodium vivax]|uniref:VIR protein n=1 Tax=Plasmodium vivax TaxID=5855 RepID=A0A1G4E7A5_PLAVI|nr:PIR protein [Plasmodium vivax]SCA60179.1 VIR protein [Plasmodium vivax]
MLDVISEKIENLRIFGTVEWVNTLNKTAIALLSRDTDFNCERKIHNIDNRHKYITKKLDDLCEDISYLNDNKEKLVKLKKCDPIVTYIKDKTNELFKNIYDDHFEDKDIFCFSKECTRQSIESKLETMNCTIEESPAAEQLQDPGDLAESEADKALIAPVGDDQEVDAYADVLEDSPSAFEIPEDIKTYGALSAAGTFFVGLLFYRARSANSMFKRRSSRRNQYVSSYPGNAHFDALLNDFEPGSARLSNSEYHIPYGSEMNS